MFVYSFFKYAGSDRVFLLDGGHNVQQGDLVRTHDDVFLVLGEESSFAEQYTTVYRHFVIVDVISSFFSASTIFLIHQLVATYYSTYKNVIDLFVPDIDVCLRLYNPHKEEASYVPVRFDQETQQFSAGQSSLPGQQLIVFPDLRSMYQALGNTHRGNNVLRHSGMTTLQKARIAQSVRQGTLSTLYTTHAGIFQAWYDLRHIVVFEPYKRYYASHQDPRYKTQDVIAMLVDLYGSTVDYIQHI